MESWKRFCPDWEFKLWNESNLDLESCDYIREAYKGKKYAFVSDVVRLEKLYQYGGVYLDVDVELLKPIDDFLNLDCFAGFESGNLINPGLIFGSKPKNEDLKNIKQFYDNTHFKTKHGYNQTTICEIMTEYYQKFGLKRENVYQRLDNIDVFPVEYFSPISTITNKKDISENTFSVHWFNASWYTKGKKIKKKLKKFLNILTLGAFGRIVYKLKEKK